jgi:16S rRNA G966 N2-methylase RsmD
MVLLLDAVAGMCVADDALCRGVAEAVAAKRAGYSAAQLAEVVRSLQRMGFTGQV